MIKRLFSTGLFALLISTRLFSQGLSDGATGKDESSIEDEVKGFYRSYLHDLNSKTPDDSPTRLSKFKASLSSKLLTHLEKIAVEAARTHEIPDDPDAGSDYFLKAQDWAKEWETHVAAKVLAKSGKKATVSVVLSGGTDGLESDELKVTLIQEKSEGWKIDKVEPVAK